MINSDIQKTDRVQSPQVSGLYPRVRSWNSPHIPVRRGSVGTATIWAETRGVMSLAGQSAEGFSIILAKPNFRQFLVTEYALLALHRRPRYA